MENEKSCELSNLRNFVTQMQKEMIENTCMEEDGVRMMREGIGLFLDDFGGEMPELTWIKYNLRFRRSSVSLEWIEKGNVTPVEGTPGGIILWNNKVNVILNTIESNLNR